MPKYIPKEPLVAEIEKLESRFQNGSDEDYADGYHYSLKLVKRILDTLEVKEIEENKLPNPRFPHLNNIVEKVFGAGNLESWEYKEAEQLVLLAKEELLKDLEAKEVDLEKLGEIARHLIAVKEHIEDMRLDKEEWLMLEKIGYPERYKTKKGE